MEKEKEILRKQLELLAELAKKSDEAAIGVTDAMCEIVRTIDFITIEKSQPDADAALIPKEVIAKMVRFFSEIEEYTKDLKPAKDS